MVKALLVVLIFAFTHAVRAAEPGWNGKRAAVVLTYDDALSQHLDIAIPTLNAHGLRGTFYITADSTGFKQRIEPWRIAAGQGHELGNHTLYHPCDGSLPGREWLNPHRDMSKWTLTQFIDNVQMTSTLLEAVDGKRSRTFAYTCGDQKVGGQSIVPTIKTLFPAARGVVSGLETKDTINLYDVRAVSGMEQNGKGLIEEVERAIEQGSLLVFLFHGVGGGHSLNVTAQAHTALIEYLAKNTKTVEVMTMLELANLLAPKASAQP